MFGHPSFTISLAVYSGGPFLLYFSVVLTFVLFTILNYLGVTVSHPWCVIPEAQRTSFPGKGGDRLVWCELDFVHRTHWRTPATDEIRPLSKCQLR